MSKKAEAVMRAMNKILKIMENRDRHEAIRNFLIQTDREFIIEMIREGRVIPKYMANLVIVLTKLYNEGYSNASENLKKFK